MKIVEMDTVREEFYEMREMNVSQIAGASNIQRMPVQTGLKVTRRVREVPVDEG